MMPLSLRSDRTTASNTTNGAGTLGQGTPRHPATVPREDGLFNDGFYYNSSVPGAYPAALYETSLFYNNPGYDNAGYNSFAPQGNVPSQVNYTPGKLHTNYSDMYGPSCAVDTRCYTPPPQTYSTPINSVPTSPVKKGPHQVPMVTIHSLTNVQGSPFSSSNSQGSPLSPSNCNTPMFGPYHLVRTLGEGSYGKVKLGIHKATGLQVAIKTIQKSSLKKSAHLVRLRREIALLQLLSSIRHANIVQLYEVHETSQEMTLVMEHCSGGELLDYIERKGRGVLEQEEARDIFGQLAEVIHFLHGLGIVHRDLKPQNILLTNPNSSSKDQCVQCGQSQKYTATCTHARPIVKLIDFGFACTYAKTRPCTTWCGSPFYAAPEMVTGAKYLGPEVDMWSLGVILFCMVTGQLPFTDASSKGLYGKIAAGKYTLPTGVIHRCTSDLNVETVGGARANCVQQCTHPLPPLSQDCKDIIGKLLTVSQQHRLTSTQLLSHRYLFNFNSQYSIADTLFKLENSLGENGNFLDMCLRVLLKLNSSVSGCGDANGNANLHTSGINSRTSTTHTTSPRSASSPFNVWHVGDLTFPLSPQVMFSMTFLPPLPRFQKVYSSSTFEERQSYVYRHIYQSAIYLLTMLQLPALAPICSLDDGGCPLREVVREALLIRREQFSSNDGNSKKSNSTSLDNLVWQCELLVLLLASTTL